MAIMLQFLMMETEIFALNNGVKLEAFGSVNIENKVEMPVIEISMI